MSFHAYKWGFWLRLGKKQKGISVSFSKPMFSERVGARKTFRIKKFKIELLGELK